jgi:Domain of unknown function (DUF4314)
MMTRTPGSGPIEPGHIWVWCDAIPAPATARPDRLAGVDVYVCTECNATYHDRQQADGTFVPAPVGGRVRLIACTDPHTRLHPGAEGTITLVDDMGTVHVRWDDGHTLGLIPGEDRWEPADQIDGGDGLDATVVPTRAREE